jgi:hypothetical protein
MFAGCSLALISPNATVHKHQPDGPQSTDDHSNGPVIYAACAARSLRAVQINSDPQLLHTKTTSSMPKSGSTDFDHLDPRWIEDPFPIWDELRLSCPIARTRRFMRAYFPSRYDDVRTIAYDTDHFSSRRVIVRETRPPLIPAPPITSDPSRGRGLL